MHHSPLLIPLLIEFAVLGCPAGYTDAGNGNCQSGKLGPSTQFLAYSSCAANNGYTLAILNGFDNIYVNSLAGGSPLWLGLTCTDSTKVSCLWDNGVAITNSSYSNFAPGHPNANIGACAYFNPTNNLWYSNSCGGSSYNYFCVTTPTSNIPSCPSWSYYFRGKCYYSLLNPHLSVDVGNCNDDCGEIASIHNTGENSYVRDVALLNAASPLYTYIGLNCTAGGCRWSDLTVYNYNAFGHLDSNIGNCVFLANSDKSEIIPKGKWVSTDCLENEVTVCKRGLICSTQTEELCSSTHYLSGTGLIKSPGYPRGAMQNHCSYIITQPKNYGVTLSFHDLNLDANSTIKIYNNMLDSIPFAILTSNSTPSTDSTTFYSADNTFGIVFETLGNVRTTWTARFGTYNKEANNCGGVYTAPGTIAGPRYAQNCTYTLKMGETRTCLKFTSYNIQAGDYVAIYDGEIATENNIAYIATYLAGRSTPQTTVSLCTSNTNYLNLVTIGHSGLSYQMFTIIAAESPDSSTHITFAHFTDLHVPSINSGITFYEKYGENYAYRYIAGSTQRVNATISYLQLPAPNWFVVLDGNYPSPVALAYGNPTRMTYQSSQQYLTVAAVFWQQFTVGYSLGFTGNFTAV